MVRLWSFVFSAWCVVGCTIGLGDGGKDVEGDMEVSGPCDGVVCETGVCVEDGVCALRVFVSSRTYSANFGALSQADADCELLATAAGLGGSWQAWMSNSTESPTQRFKTTPAGRPYVLPYSHVRVADGWSDLLDGTLSHPIDETEKAGSAPPVTSMCENVEDGPSTLVWTGTSNAGLSAGADCYEWTSIEDSTFVYAAYGDYTQVELWSEGVLCTGNCKASYAIYCFEQ